jgi:hypothetical protein
MKKRFQQLAGLKPLYEQERGKPEAPLALQNKVINEFKEVFKKLDKEVGSKLEGYSPIREHYKKVRKLIKSVIKETIQKQDVENYLKTGNLSPSQQSAVDIFCADKPPGTPIPPSIIGLDDDGSIGSLDEHYYYGGSFPDGMDHSHMPGGSILFCQAHLYDSSTQVMAKKCDFGSIGTNYGPDDFYLDPTNAPNGPHWQVGDVFIYNGTGTGNQYPSIGVKYYIVQVYGSFTTTHRIAVDYVPPSEGYCCGCSDTVDSYPNQGTLPYWPNSSWNGHQLFIDWHAMQTHVWGSNVDPYASYYTGPSGECWNWGQNDGACAMPAPCCCDTQATNYDPNCIGMIGDWTYQAQNHGGYPCDITVCSYFNTNPISGSIGDYWQNVNAPWTGYSAWNPINTPAESTISRYFAHMIDMLDDGYSWPVVCEWLRDKLDDIQSHPSFNNTQQQNPMNYAFYLNTLANYLQDMVSNVWGCDDPLTPYGIDPNTGNPYTVVNPNTGLNFDVNTWEPGFTIQANNANNPCNFLANKISNWQSSLVNAGPAQSAMLNQKIAVATNLCQQNNCTNC